MVRILQLARCFDIGNGMTRSILDLVRHGDPQRFQHHLCVGDGYNRVPDAARRVPVLELPPQRRFPGFRTLGLNIAIPLASLIRRNRISIVHCHDRKLYPFGAVAATLSGARLLRTVHEDPLFDTITGERIEERNLRRPSLRRWLSAKLTDRFVLVGAHTLEATVRWYGADPARISTIPNGINLGEFFVQNAERRAGTRRALNVPEREVLLLSVGRLVAPKGFDTVLDALSLLQQRGLAFRFLAVGEGPEQARLEAQARANGLAERVQFLGLRTDMPDLYNAADLLVTGTWSEAQSRGVVESMACGKPIVATAVRGMEAVIEDGKTGILVPVKRPDLMADALARLMTDAGLRLAMGAAAADRARRRFSVERMVEQYEAVYLELAGAPKLLRRFPARRGEGGAAGIPPSPRSGEQ